MDFAASCTRSGGDVFGTELFVEAGLEGGDFLRGVVGDVRAVVGEGVGGGVGVAVLVTWSGIMLVQSDM